MNNMLIQSASGKHTCKKNIISLLCVQGKNIRVYTASDNSFYISERLIQVLGFSGS